MQGLLRWVSFFVLEAMASRKGLSGKSPASWPSAQQEENAAHAADTERHGAVDPPACGFLGRKGDGEPGAKRIGTGIDQVFAAAETLRALREGLG